MALRRSFCLIITRLKIDTVIQLKTYRDWLAKTIRPKDMKLIWNLPNLLTYIYTETEDTEFHIPCKENLKKAGVAIISWDKMTAKQKQ